MMKHYTNLYHFTGAWRCVFVAAGIVVGISQVRRMQSLVERLPDKVLIVCLPAFDNRITFVVEFAGFFLHLRLPPKQNALGAHDASTASVL